MYVNDNIVIPDSTSGRFYFPDEDYAFPIETHVMPADSLWGESTLVTDPAQYIKGNKDSEFSLLDSALIMMFFIIVILFFREILTTTPSIVKSIFSHKENLRIEEKLVSSTQRDITAVIAALFFPVFLTITVGERISGYSGIADWMQFLIAIGFVMAFWIVKSLILKFLGWITKNKQTFILVGKIGYNHLIMAAIFSTPIFLTRFFIPELNFLLFYKMLIYCALFFYLLYLVRVYQTIILNRFSHIFYILYLCSVEFLPIALFTNFLLSYQ